MDRARLAATVAGLLVLAAAPAASARAFYIIQSGPNDWTVMDPQGIETAADGVRKAWAVRVQRNILAGNPPQPGYVRTLTEYDCAASRTRWRDFSAYSRSGKLLVSKVNPNPEWGPSNEAGDTNAAYRVVCEGVGGGSIVSADTVAKVVISLMSAWDPPPAPISAMPVMATPAPAPAPKAAPKPASAKPAAASAKPAAPKPK